MSSLAQGKEGRISDHTAVHAAMGYFYQAKWALLELLRGSANRPDATISVELYDDVAWHEAESAIELLQVKHHLATSRPLTDMSTDLWRTIGVWLDAGLPFDPDGPALTLLTTQLASPGSAVAALRPQDANADDAVRLLETAARESNAESTRAARERFLAMSPNERSLFVGRIRVIDASPTITDVDGLVEAELRWAIPVSHGQPFLERLWGWWFERVVDMLRGEDTRISALTLKIFLDDLRSAFADDNLPTFSDIQLRAESVGEYDSRQFVHQLRWVNVTQAIIRKAISDYYRSYAHTARWLQEDLVGIDELRRFENRLIDEWETAFEWMQMESTAADEDQKQVAGRRLLRERLQQTVTRIRERYSDPYFARGKHHELADTGEIGWHPEYRERLGQLGGDQIA